MEVDHQPQGRVQEPHVAKSLGQVDREKLFHGFDLNHEASINQKIEADLLLENEVLVGDRAESSRSTGAPRKVNSCSRQR